MKKELIIFALSLILLSGIFISADIFDSTWGSGEGEINIGGMVPEPPQPSPPETPSGGGGGRPPQIEEGFTISPTLIPAKVTKGRASQEKIIITNIGRTNLQFKLSVDNVSKYVFPEETSFTINSGQSREVILNIYISEQEKINFSMGKINVRAKDMIKTADIILDIRDKSALFDIKTTLLKKILMPGQKAFAEILVLNFGDLKNIDVALETSLIDENQNVYDIKKEMFAINDSYEGQFFVTIPRDIAIGNYIFHSKVSYQNVTAESYDTFEVIKFLINFAAVILYIITAIVVILITLISIVLRHKIKHGTIEEQGISYYG